MKMLIILSFLLFLKSCSVNEKAGEPLPKSMPDKFSISYNNGGGMVYLSESMFISQDSCNYIYNNGGAISKIHFKVTIDELGSLYKTFYQNEFDRIKSHNETIYDRGGISVSLRWGQGKYVSKQDAGMTIIDKNWQKEWSACINELEELMSKKISEQEKEFKVKISNELSDTLRSFTLDNKTVFSNNEKTNLTKTIKLIPGEHHIGIGFKTKFENIHITSESNGIKFYSQDGILKYRYME